MKGCEAIHDELKAYVDGELPLARRAVVRLHLVRCRPCREEREAMEEIALNLQAGDPDEFTPDLRARIMDSAAPELPIIVTDNPAPIPWWRQRSLQFWGAAASLVAVWFIFMPVFSQSRERARSSSPTDVLITTNSQPAGGGAGSPMADDNATADLLKAHNMAPEQVRAIGPQMNATEQEMARRMAGGPSAGQVGDSFSSSRVASAGRGGPLESKRDYTFGQPDVRPISAGYKDSHSNLVSLPSMQRHVVKAADITVEVEKLEEKSDSVERMVRESGGFVANNQLTTQEDGTKASSLTLKVPVDKFDSTLTSIAKLGEVKAKNVTGEDITEKVSDGSQEARVIRDELQGAQAKAKNNTRGTGVDDRAEMLRHLKIRLAQAEGRLEGLKKLSALATMNVQLREKSRTAIRGGGFLDEMGDTGRSAVNSFLMAARLPVLLLIWIAAYAPVWIPLAIAYRYAARAHKTHVAARESREWQAKRAQQTV